MRKRNHKSGKGAFSLSKSQPLGETAKISCTMNDHHLTLYNQNIMCQNKIEISVAVRTCGPCIRGNMLFSSRKSPIFRRVEAFLSARFLLHTWYAYLWWHRAWRPLSRCGSMRRFALEWQTPRPMRAWPIKINSLHYVNGIHIAWEIRVTENLHT